MIIVKNATRAYNSDYWKKNATGELDVYGNPFQLIELRWNSNPLHQNSDYGKTRGFEDTIITVNPRTRNLAISYRKPGSVMWMRPGGAGAFVGEVAKTPYNMKKLASMYADKLWTIRDPVIDQEVRIMYEAMEKAWDEKTREFNIARIKSMHTHHLEALPSFGSDPKATAKEDLSEEKKILFKQRQEMEKMILELKEKEKQIAEKEKKLMVSGVSSTVYGREYLEKLSLADLRKTAKVTGAKFKPINTREELVSIIMNKQDGIKEEALDMPIEEMEKALNDKE
jgi:hypothetical protein